MLEAGAHGFVEKTAGLSNSRKVWKPWPTAGLTSAPRSLPCSAMSSPIQPRSATRPDFLTDREREILQLVAESHSTREIAEKLGISVKTVDNHRTNLMRKLNLHDVASLYPLRARSRHYRTEETRLKSLPIRSLGSIALLTLSTSRFHSMKFVSKPFLLISISAAVLFSGCTQETDPSGSVAATDDRSATWWHD